MGAGASHPVAPTPIVDYRLFHELTVNKSKQSITHYTISPQFSSDSTPSQAYSADLRPGYHSRTNNEEPDIVLSKIDEEQKDGVGDAVGSIRFVKGEGIKISFEEGDDDKEQAFRKVERGGKAKWKGYEFSLPSSAGGKTEEKFTWIIVRHGGLGAVREVVLRAAAKSPNGVEEETDEEEREGEIVAVWKKKGVFRTETSFWINTMFAKKRGDNGWEGAVILSGLGVVEGWARK